jgi:hypothetical protein
MMAGPVFGVFLDDYSTDFCGQFLPQGPPCEGRNIWPKISWDIDGDESVLHVVTAEFGGGIGDRQTCSYYRRVGDYGSGNGVWSDQRVIDTVMNVNVSVASSPISDRVAIVWNCPADYKRDTDDEFENQIENDVWYTIVNDNGLDWASNPTNMGNPSIAHLVDNGTYPGGNITNYDPMGDYKAYCDMSSLFALTTDAPNDELQIVWNSRRFIDTSFIYFRQSAIFHWRESTGEIKTVVKADWDTGGICQWYSWALDVAKMTISECDNKLYVCYTQFGDKDHPCYWYDANDNVLLGLLYMSVYDPFYGAWDRPKRVTDLDPGDIPCTPADTLGPGDCHSEYWASMARYGRIDTCQTVPPDDVLDILYIDDIAPGGVIQDESGIWAANPVNWTIYPCRDAVPEPGYSDDAGPGYGLCVNEPILLLGPLDSTNITLTLENFGILDNSPVSISITIDSGGIGNTFITATPNSNITIPKAGGTVPIDIQIKTVNEQDQTTVYATITVTHQAGDTPPTDRIIPMCIMVVYGFPIGQSEIIATACKRLKVYNNGQLSNEGTNASLDFMDPPDPDDCANMYLYDGSPLICRDDGGEAKCYFSVFDAGYGADNALRQNSPMFVDSTTHESYTYATAEFLTADSAIGLISEYFAPKHTDSCSFIIQKLKFWNRTEVTLSGVAVGEVLDWDIPSFDHASNNESSFDAGRELIYQYCCDSDPCDSADTCERFGGIAAWEELPFKNYMTLQNDTFVYSTSNFGNEAPLPDDTMLALMTGNDGFDTTSIDSCEDLFTLVTFDVYDLAPNDTQCVVKILSTSRYDPGAATLKENIDKGNAFIADHEEIHCETFVCDCLPGDANEDGQVNIGDAVYVIAYVFKGGPPPSPYAMCSGDANCDGQCNIGDAVYVIAYVFKGGPPPCTCEEWVAEHGPPLRK